VRIAIIEDEPLAAEDLERTLLSIDQSGLLSVSVKLDSVKTAVEWLSNNSVDLILSDIELGDGLSFEIFNQLKIDTPIIMTTAYDQYAIRAFKENSIDYLLKPIDQEELELAINKYKTWTKASRRYDIDSLLEALDPNTTPAYQERFLITLGERIKSIPETQVAYFFSEDRYTYLVTKIGQQHIINNNLGELEEALNPKKFYRINRKFIISFLAIKTMLAYSKSRVKIDLDPPAPNSMDVIVSVERSGAFKRWLNG